jgi:hypothetical protein
VAKARLTSISPCAGPTPSTRPIRSASLCGSPPTPARVAESSPPSSSTISRGECSRSSAVCQPTARPDEDEANASAHPGHLDRCALE